MVRGAENLTTLVPNIQKFWNPQPTGALRTCPSYIGISFTKYCYILLHSGNIKINLNVQDNFFFQNVKSVVQICGTNTWSNNIRVNAVSGRNFIEI
jgi:hypothetical protein